MKTKTTIVLAFVLAIINLNLYAQVPDVKGGGKHVFNQDQVPCLTDSQRQEVINLVTTSYNNLKAEGRLAFSEDAMRIPNPAFIWPVKKVAGSLYNEAWAISNYVDQNQAYPNVLQDYNCEARTYDTTSGYNHQGIDIFTWPFTWKLVDDNGVEIVAAAEGQIIAKGDGQFDRSCNFNSNQWNAVYVQHNDGSVAWYGHMKNGSLTTKNVGEMVAQGEFLGIVGSSGNSTGPHLHFEVHTDNSYTQLVDPYYYPTAVDGNTGLNCNTMNTESWWANQKPYLNPSVNAAFVHSALPDWGTCPTTEITNITTEILITDTPYFAVYLKDQVAGTSVNLITRRPDNSIQEEWNFDLTDNYLASWWYWSFQLDTVGQWTWEATYNGQTDIHTFMVNEALGINNEELVGVSIYPNPSRDIVNISSNTSITNIQLHNILGKSVLEINNADGIDSFKTNALLDGVYFLTLEDNSSRRKTIKLIKN